MCRARGCARLVVPGRRGQRDRRRDRLRIRPRPIATREAKSRACDDSHSGPDRRPLGVRSLASGDGAIDGRCGSDCHRAGQQRLRCAVEPGVLRARSRTVSEAVEAGCSRTNIVPAGLAGKRADFLSGARALTGARDRPPIGRDRQRPRRRRSALHRFGPRHSGVSRTRRSTSPPTTASPIATTR